MTATHQDLAALAREFAQTGEYSTRLVSVLYRCAAALEAASQPPGAVEKGPFTVDQSANGTTHIYSEDFRHDVTLIVRGDFHNNAAKKAYAQGLADILNAALSAPSPAPAPAPVVQDTLEITDEELQLFDHTIEQFCDCGETDTPYETLMKWANRGWLECEHFVSTAEGNRVLAGIGVKGADHG